MKKKIFVIGICALFIILAIPSSTAKTESQVTVEEDVEISISAGYRGKDNGHGICVNIINHKTEDVEILYTLTLDYLFQNGRDGTYTANSTVSPDLPHSVHISTVICTPDGIKLITFTAESEGTVVTRNGISISHFVFLFN